jgi:phosphatidylserine synthase
VTDEDQKERLDRELIELLNELRIALPGVQVLFAFLLILPFSNGFEKLTEAERIVYFAAVLCTMVSTALLIAPSTYHRIRFREHDKERLIQISNRLAIAGTLLLAAAISCAIYLISEVVFNPWVGLVTTAVTVVTFGWFWYGLPLSRPPARRR